MTNQVTAFSFGTMSLRTVMRDGNPWFVATDLCEALALSNASMALGNVGAEDKAKFNLGLRGSAPWVVNESGLYDLIFQSRKPEAREFKKWVTSVVLPAIRKDGAYVMGEEKVATGEMTEDDLIAKALLAVHKKAERLTAENAALTARVVEQAPAVEFVAKYVKAEGTQPLTDVAKTLGVKPRYFVEVLEGTRVIFRRKPTAQPVPHQEVIDKGYMVALQHVTQRGNAYAYSHVTAKGVKWLSENFTKLAARYERTSF